MIGVVLCGGGSTRMKADKGLIKEEEETWAEIAARKLKALQLPVVLSINALQHATYEQIFFPEQLLVDNNEFDAKAPLFGILSVHLQFPAEDLLVLACDIRDMSTELMQHLCNEYQQGTHEAYIYQTGDMPQPLCGLYTAAGLKKIYSLFQNHQLKRYSMMHVLEVLNTKYLAAKAGDLPAFNNYNNPDDL